LQYSRLLQSERDKWTLSKRQKRKKRRRLVPKKLRGNGDKYFSIAISQASPPNHSRFENDLILSSQHNVSCRNHSAGARSRLQPRDQSCGTSVSKLRLVRGRLETSSSARCQRGPTHEGILSRHCADGPEHDCRSVVPLCCWMLKVFGRVSARDPARSGRLTSAYDVG
jgi:hypothetical protein